MHNDLTTLSIKVNKMFCWLSRYIQVLLCKICYAECCHSNYGYAGSHYTEHRSDKNSFAEKFLEDFDIFMSELWIWEQIQKSVLQK